MLQCSTDTKSISPTPNTPQPPRSHTTMSASFTWKTTAEEAAKTFASEIKGKIGEYFFSCTFGEFRVNNTHAPHLPVLVTGVSNRSLGQETVRVLAPYAKTIIVASRSKERYVAAKVYQKFPVSPSCFVLGSTLPSKAHARRTPLLISASSLLTSRLKSPSVLLLPKYLLSSSRSTSVYHECEPLASAHLVYLYIGRDQQCCRTPVQHACAHGTRIRSSSRRESSRPLPLQLLDLPCDPRRRIGGRPCTRGHCRLSRCPLHG